MLKLKYLFENYGLAKEALENWEHDEDTLDRMLSQFRISSNAIYPFCQNGEVCFLRLSPLEEKMENNVFGEMEFIRYLLERGYPALKPIGTKTGELCLKLDTEWGQFYAAAFSQSGRRAGRRHGAVARNYAGIRKNAGEASFPILSLCCKNEKVDAQ